MSREYHRSWVATLTDDLSLGPTYTEQITIITDDESFESAAEAIGKLLQQRNAVRGSHKAIRYRLISLVESHGAIVE